MVLSALDPRSEKMADNMNERELLALQDQFLSSNMTPAATVKKSSKFKLQAQAHKSTGQSFQLDFEGQQNANTTPRDSVSQGFIKDIIERNTEQSARFLPPIPMDKDGPRVQKLDWRNKLRPPSASSSYEKHSISDLKSQIDEENRRKVDGMSLSQLEAEKAELLRTLDPEVLRSLLRRSEQRQAPQAVFSEQELGPQFTSEAVAEIPEVKSTTVDQAMNQGVRDRQAPPRETAKAINMDGSSSFQISADADSIENKQLSKKETIDAPAHHGKGKKFVHLDEEIGSQIHFPSDPLVQSLDPSSATFLEDLKTKYYPNLDYNPSSLQWMQPPTEVVDQSDYHITSESLMPAQLRFDFQANFLTPKMSRAIDTQIGLHHHADAPSAAGYTIPELAHLCRSTYPSQACMAIQTIGRVMFKIGQSFYGLDVSRRLRTLVEKSKVEVTLLERARDRHMGISSYATEALWQANLGREGHVVHSV